MPGNSTVYDVRVKYALDDRASSGARGIASACDKASTSAFSLKNALIGIGGIAALNKAKSALIDFNSEIDQMKISLSTVMQMQLSMPLAKANKEADRLFNTFQELAKKSPATTKDFMEMSSAIAPAVALAGGGPDKLAEITQGAVIAGIALGERADVAALDVKQMLAGTVSAKDRMAQQLLASQKITGEDFNAKSAGERFNLVQKMLSQDALKTAADQFGESFKGQVSSIKDNLQIAFGEVGKPLMSAMAAEVKKMNEWMTRHPKLIAETISSLGSMIKDAFGFVKSVASWLVENRDTLFTIGKTFLIFKGAQLGTGLIRSFKDGIGNMVDSLRSGAGSIQSIFGAGSGQTMLGRFGQFTSLLGRAIPAVTLFSGALEIAASYLRDYAEDDKKARSAQISLHEATQDIPGMMSRRRDLQQALAGKGVMGGLASNDEMRSRFQTELQGLESKLFNPHTMGEVIRKISDESKKFGGSGFENLTLAQMQNAERMLPSMFDSRDAAKSKQITEEVLQVLRLFKDQTVEARREILKAAFPEQWGQTMARPDAPSPAATWTGPSKSDVNVTIHKIEVASEDPDRFVFGVAKLAENAAKHPTSSQHTIVGGF